jgi:hypothetical protein
MMNCGQRLPRCILMAGFLGVFCLVSILIQPYPALAKPVSKPAVSQPNIPVGSVSATEALKRIEAHMNTIAKSKAAMMALYGYKPSIATMTEAFQRNGANQWAIDQYASTWGQNGLYLTWDVVANFYIAHYEALQQSAESIQTKKSPSVPKEDLSYLDQGMSAWVFKEKEVQARYRDYLDTKGKSGAAIGLSHELWAHKNESAAAEARYNEADGRYYHHTRIASSLDKALREIGYKTRLFSAISAKERIVAKKDPNLKMAPGQ